MAKNVFSLDAVTVTHMDIRVCIYVCKNNTFYRHEAYNLKNVFSAIECVLYSLSVYGVIVCVCVCVCVCVYTHTHTHSTTHNHTCATDENR